jgi:hypothetical protein
MNSGEGFHSDELRMQLCCIVWSVIDVISPESRAAVSLPALCRRVVLRRFAAASLVLTVEPSRLVTFE